MLFSLSFCLKIKHGSFTLVDAVSSFKIERWHKIHCKSRQNHDKTETNVNNNPNTPRYGLFYKKKSPHFLTCV